ncbi:hypothetical protein AMECASPLE_030299, partial [Ameca splendens]
LLSLPALQLHFLTLYFALPHFFFALLAQTSWGDGDQSDKVLESVKAEDILTDSEIKDLERNLQSGNVLSNRMYLWKHRGLDPVLRKYYSEHITTFNDMMQSSNDLKVLSVPGNGAEIQQFILEVLLPEVVIQWLQGSNNMC